MPSSPGIGMHVEVKDPDDKVVLSRVYSSEGERKAKNSLKWLLTLLFDLRSYFLHKSHSRRACHLHVFEFDGLVQRISAPSTS